MLSLPDAGTAVGDTCLDKGEKEVAAHSRPNHLARTRLLSCVLMCRANSPPGATYFSHTSHLEKIVKPVFWE